MEAQDPLANTKTNESAPRTETTGVDEPDATASEEKLNGDIGSTEEVESVAQAEPEILPAVSPEEQYRFALGRALQTTFKLRNKLF